MEIKLCDDAKYKLKVNRKTINLYYGEGFAKSGTIAYSLEDTGNEYIFRDHFLQAKTTLDYSQLEALSIISSIIE